MEAELCSGSSALVNKKRKRKTKKSNRNGSDLRIDKENYFPEKNSSVNVIISLPSRADSSSAQENSKAQPCNESNPLPANGKKKKRKKKKRKIQETSTAQGDTGAEVPYTVLQANEPEVEVNMTCSSGDSRQSLEHEKIQPTSETNCLTTKQQRKKEKKKLKRRKKKEAKTKENVSGKSSMLAEIPSNVSQVASTGTSNAEASVHDPEQRLDLPERTETIKLHSAGDGSAEVVLVESTAVTEATENKNAEKLFQVPTAEEHVTRLDKEIEAASNCNGEASVGSGLFSCCEHSNRNGVKVDRQIDEVNPSSELSVSKGDIRLDIDIDKGSMPLQIPDILSERTSVEPSRKKLLILDLNGLLADIIPYVGCGCKPDLIVSRKAVFKRPFVDDFLQFCFDKFAVGVWSSRTKRNVDPVVDFLMGDSKGKLLFCWDQSHCTITKFTTVENRDKPLVLKELRKLWDKLEPNLPWEKGAYDESNTLLLDDSPYKALRNPANTGIFPYSYHCRDAKDNSLGPGGDLRVYLESLALANDVRKYVEQNPFGQRAITKSNPSWNYYKRVLAADPPEDATSIWK